MAHCEESQEEKTNHQGSHRFPEEFTVRIQRVKEFYRVVSILNRECGHGNWTTQGRPVRLIRRVDEFNRLLDTYGRYSFIPGPGARQLEYKAIDVVFCVPAASKLIASRIVLELSR